MEEAAATRENLLAQVEWHSMGQGWGPSSQLPQPSVPPQVAPQGPCPSLQGLKGRRCPDRVFYLQQVPEIQPWWCSNPSPHLEMNSA